VPFALYLFAFFEAPLSALAVAAGAVSIPIIIHLLNRRRFRVVTWAAMRFLLAAQRKNSRRMRLEQIILLALRCLCVLLLVLAMASVTPWAEALWHWLAPGAAQAVSTSNSRTHKILVIDGSFSMGLKVGDVSCFEKARALATQIVRDGSGGDGFSVVLMASPPRRIVPEPSEDGRKVATEIASLRLTHGNADLPATLNTVESLVRGSPGKFPDKEVYFLTDMQQSTWILRQPDAVAALIEKIQSKARTIFIDVGKDGVNNLAVTNLMLGEPLATTGRETPIVATLHNHGDTRQEVSVRLLVGRARAASADKPCELREVGEVLVSRVQRGQQTEVAFKYKFPSPGEYVVQVQCARDSLDLDDVRSAVVTVKDSIPVMLVNGKPATEVYDRATGWLQTALNPFDEGASPANIVARPKVLTRSQFADEGLGDLLPFDCVFLCDVPRLSLGEARRLDRHVRRGGGVVITLGDQIDLGAYNEVLFRDGTGLLPARLMGRQKATPGYTYGLAIDPEADREDPLKPFRDAGARERLLEPRFQQFIQVESAPRAGPRKVMGFIPVTIPGARIVKSTPPPGGPAILEWHPPAGKELGAGRLRGRVILVTTTVNTDWNNWPASPSFPPLLTELLNFAAASRLREQSVQVGEPIELFLPGASGTLDAVVHTPDGRQESVRTQSLEEASVLRWTDTDISGIYRVVIGQHPREYLFAVNVPSLSEAQQLSESNLARTSLEELQKVYHEWKLQVVTDPNQVVRTGSTTTGTEVVLNPLGGEVAHMLLLVLLVLVLVEVVLAWQFGHYSAAPMEQPAQQPTRNRWRWVLVVLPCLLFTFLLGGGFVLAHEAWTGDLLAFLPDVARRWFEGVVGVPPPAPGEGSRWRLEYSVSLWNRHSDPWLVGTLAAAAAVLVFLIYRREGRTARTGYRLVLVGLRMGLLLLLLVVFLPQLKLWFERQGWPDVVVIIDDSESMSTVDRYRDPQIQAVAERLAKQSNLTEADRLHLAQALLTRSEPDWLTALLTQRKVRLHVYHCSTRAHRFSDIHSAEDIRPALDAIQNLRAEPKNDSSQLGTAVRQVLNDFRGSSLAAAVMLTDGITTEGEDLAKVAKYSSQMGVPLFFVGIGDAQEVRDVYLHDLQVEDSVYVNDRVVFEVRVTAQGYSNLNVPVTLREKGSNKVLDTKNAQIDENHKTVKVRLIHQPTEPGEKIFEVTLPEQADEVDKDNNRLERPVSVREAKLIRVLYVEGYRRYEYHFVKTLLERESNRIKGNKSIDLKVFLQDADPDFPEQDRSAIANFPTKEELKAFDVVIVGDIDPRPDGDPKMAEHLKDLADFVREKGGGLVLLAGERHSPQEFKDSPLKDVLPIDIMTDKPANDGPEGGLENSYRPELTSVGRMHPIFRFKPDEKENEEVWAHLRELFWYAEGYQPKRAAEVLAVHPKLQRADKKPGAADKDLPLADRHPLVVQQFVGAGRTLFFGFNESWRWNFREDQQFFNQFWVQTVRYLARSRLGRIDLRIDRQTPYRRGEPIKITVRFPDDAPPPPQGTKVIVVSERRGPKRGADTEVRTIQLNEIKGSRATYEALLTQTPEGEYKFWLSEPVAPNPKPRAECKVLAPPGEMERLRMNQAEMERAAEESHGRFYSLADADRLLEELPVGTRVTVNAPGPPWLVWNHFVLFLAALLFLTTEWLLRKQKNLL
jgi:hypothetical protein